MDGSSASFIYTVIVNSNKVFILVKRKWTTFMINFTGPSTQKSTLSFTRRWYRNRSPDFEKCWTYPNLTYMLIIELKKRSVYTTVYIYRMMMRVTWKIYVNVVQYIIITTWITGTKKVRWQMFRAYKLVHDSLFSRLISRFSIGFVE